MPGPDLACELNGYFDHSAPYTFGRLILAVQTGCGVSGCKFNDKSADVVDLVKYRQVELTPET